MVEQNFWNRKGLAKSHLLLGIAILSWFMPFTQAAWAWMDHQFFYLLNGTLSSSGDAWTTFWGYANHKSERRYCPMVMASISLAWILFGRSKKDLFYRAGLTIFFWAFMEAWIPLTNVFIQKVLLIKRQSPSLVLEPVVRLSEVLSFGPIRDASAISFPSGHSYVMSFWTFFTWYCSPRLGKVALTLCLANSLPRLFAGAHWLSDCIFAFLIANVILSWALATPLHHIAGTRIAALLRKIRPSITPGAASEGQLSR